MNIDRYMKFLIQEHLGEITVVRVLSKLPNVEITCIYDDTLMEENLIMNTMIMCEMVNEHYHKKAVIRFRLSADEKEFFYVEEQAGFFLNMTPFSAEVFLRPISETNLEKYFKKELTRRSKNVGDSEIPRNKRRKSRRDGEIPES